MIIGIGTDIIEIERVENAIKKNSRFIDKILTPNEKKQLDKKGFKVESIAGRFAAKEAISKALGTGFRGFSFNDIEIINNEVGKPIVILSDKLKETLNIKNNINIMLSISHNRNSAIAFAMIEE
ncbi:MAG: holo-ACP synthase [Clostridium sp.]